MLCFLVMVNVEKVLSDHTLMNASVCSGALPWAAHSSLDNVLSHILGVIFGVGSQV